MDEQKIESESQRPQPKIIRNHPITFIPNLFKINSSKPTLITAMDPFITDDAAKEYCSILSNSEDVLPRYLQHYEKFTDNVLDISPNVFEDIAKMHVERETQFMEEEKKEDERLIQQHHVELTLKQTLDLRVNQFLQIREHYVKRSCPVKIPFKSTLNHEEHEFYLKCFIKYQIRPPANRLEQKEYDQYLSMQNRVFNEQSCMMNFSYKVAQLAMKSYNNVPPIIDTYISNYVSHRSRRAFSYPKHYKNEMQIPLKPQESFSNTDHFQLEHLGHLLSLGWMPVLKLPNKKFETKFPMDESVAAKKMVNCDNEFDRSKFLHKCPVSEDPNAEYLAKKHGVSVVMSSSSFKTIVDNQEQTFEKEWNIPVRIKTVKSKDEHGKEVDCRIVFIDKPLPRKSWLPLQKKFTFFKASAKGRMMRCIPSPSFKLGPVRHSIPYDDIFDDDINSSSSSAPPSPSYRKKIKKQAFIPASVDIANDLLLSEDDGDHDSKTGSPGVQSPSPSSSPSGKKENGDDGTCFPPNLQPAPPLKSVPLRPLSPPPSKMKSKEAGGLLDSLLDKQESFLKHKSTAESSEEQPPLLQTSSRRETKLKNKNGQCGSTILSTDWADHTIKPCTFGAGTNVHYQLFSFERTEQSPVKEERVEPLRILFRHNIHGSTVSKKCNQDRKPYILFPKLENQVYFGCEVNSISEIVQQWAALVTRPDTTLLQLRLCVDSGALVMSEEKTLETVLKEGKQNHLNFNPQTIFSTLNVLFNTLKKMSSGDYILHHSPKTEAFIVLLKSFNSEVTMYPSRLDLHNLYCDEAITSRQYKNPPWLAIDTHVITPFHKFHKKIPGTFPMENNVQLDKRERKKRKEKANKKMVIEGYE